MSNLKVKDAVRKPTEGFFKLETIDKDGNIIDTFGKQNMIMQSSKASVANATMGDTLQQYNFINKIVLGTKGSENGNLLVGRDFSFTRTQLFSQTEGGDTFTILFDPLSRGGDGTAPTLQEFASDGITKTSSSKVKVTIVNSSTIEYVFDIDPGSGNSSTSESGVNPWTEAALFTKKSDNINYNNLTQGSPINNGNIFAMRTFPAKIKDASTTFRITWQIVF